MSLSRRRFLSTTALAGAGAGAALLAGQPAAAFTEKQMDAETHKIYASACGGPDAAAYHQELLAEAKTKLPGGISEVEIETAIAAPTCPVCGCRLAG
jgi:fructoselysine-6-P-deglycase FrlB-like protein